MSAVATVVPRKRTRGRSASANRADNHDNNEDFGFVLFSGGGVGAAFARRRSFRIRQKVKVVKKVGRRKMLLNNAKADISPHAYLWLVYCQEGPSLPVFQNSEMTPFDRNFLFRLSPPPPPLPPPPPQRGR